MNASDDLEQLVNKTLSELGRFLNLDRLTFHDVYADQGQMVPRWQWYSDTARGLRLEMNEDLSGRFPWLTQKVLEGILFVVEDIEQIPESAAAHKRSAGNMKRPCRHS